VSRIQSNRHEQVGKVIKEERYRLQLCPYVWVIKKLIGPAKARLLKYIEEANVTLARAFEDKDCDEEDIRVDELITRIKTTCTILERCNSDWASLLKDFKREE